ncbi:MAG: multiheme c-type cytochrome, partial [Planctomycetota bacterium]
MRLKTRFKLLILLALPASIHAGEEEKHPVYVGAAVCASCHQGKDMGDQHSLWLLSKHARAFAVLSQPESNRITELSGITHQPQEAALCLGCHATGAHVEEWEKDPTFHVEDGVQCEKCHGPGSEYSADARIMRDREAAVAAGLIIPTKRDCLGCHQPKGSHERVHKLPRLDMDEAWETIAHPTPKPSMTGEPPLLPEPADGGPPQPKYAGVAACAACHMGPKTGFQFSRWKLSPHARAYAVLATPRAYEIADEMGVKGNFRENPKCLKCHTTAHHRPAGGVLESFDISEGVGCEACHGAGSEYLHEAVMKDKPSAEKAGLREVTRETCLACHENAHQKPFDYEEAIAKIAHPNEPPEVIVGPRYKTPLNMALSPNGRDLYVTCEASHTVIVVDAVARRKVAEIPTGGHPTEVAFSPDGTRAYVTNRLDDSVSVIHVAARKVLQTIPVGDEPHGVLTDGGGKHLYVLNTSAGSISVIDTESMKEVKRLAASRSPWSLALSPDGSRIAVTNSLSRFVEFRTPSVSEVTLIDTEGAVVEDRVVVPAANLLQGVAWHPSGEFALITLNRTKNLVPMTRLLQGWTITNGLGVIWKDGRVDQVLLDEPNLAFPDPADVAVTPDGRLALVTSSGSDRVAVVDLAKLISMLQAASEDERERVFPNHLGKPTEFVIAKIPTKSSPRGILIAPDGKTAFAANALDDSLTVIDLAKLEAAGRIDLGGPKVITKTRQGELLFHSADGTFHRQFSCHSCHPDGHIDGVTYD